MQKHTGHRWEIHQIPEGLSAGQAVAHFESLIRRHHAREGDAAEIEWELDESGYPKSADSRPAGQLAAN
jgi:hypothetical protein